MRINARYIDLWRQLIFINIKQNGLLLKYLQKRANISNFICGMCNWGCRAITLIFNWWDSYKTQGHRFVILRKKKATCKVLFVTTKCKHTTSMNTLTRFMTVRNYEIMLHRKLPLSYRRSLSQINIH